MASTSHGTAVLVPDVVMRGGASSGWDGPDPTATYAAAVAGWLSQYKARTRDDYKRVLGMFDTWCRATGRHPFTLTRGEIQAWTQELERRGLMPSTQSHYIIVVQSFYRYAHEEEFLERNPAAKVRRPVFDDSNVARSFMSRSEAARFIAASEKTRPPFRARDHALACVLVATAPLAPLTYWALVNYIGDRTSGPVFLGQQGERLCAAIVRRRVVAIAKAANISKHLTPHSARRTFITGALDAGVPMRDVQIAARHADPRTTSRYDQRRESLDRHPTYVLGGFLAD